MSFASIFCYSVFLDSSIESKISRAMSLRKSSYFEDFTKSASGLDNIYKRQYPSLPSRSSDFAALIIELEYTIREIDVSSPLLPEISHKQQVLYRFLSQDQNFSDKVISLLPYKYKRIANRHLKARREFLNMSLSRSKPDVLPAWEIIPPEPADKLIAYYKKAQADTGIDWEILAAINLVETGLGRISGRSVANAQGPMQFLETTWNLPGIGMDKDIDNPHDSIQAAARYLVQRGGLENIKKGLWGYNNSEYYGRAVLEYSEILKEDPRSFKGFYYWQIHFNSSKGDIWLPVGYKQNQSIPISTYLKQFPASAPPDYSFTNSD